MIDGAMECSMQDYVPANQSLRAPDVARHCHNIKERRWVNTRIKAPEAELNPNREVTMTTEEKTWMNLNSVSSYSNLSSSFIRRMVSEGRIRHTRSSSETSKLLFRREWVDSFLESNSKQPKQDEL